MSPRKKKKCKKVPRNISILHTFPRRNEGVTFFPCQPFPPLRSVLCFPLRPSISFPHSPKGRSERRRRRRGNRRWMRWRSSAVDEAAGGRPTLLIPLCSLSLFRFQSWDFVIDLSPRELRSESKAMPHTLLETERPWSLFFLSLLEKRENRNSLLLRRGTCNLCGHPPNVPYFSPSPRSHTERGEGRNEDETDLIFRSPEWKCTRVQRWEREAPCDLHPARDRPPTSLCPPLSPLLQSVLIRAGPSETGIGRHSPTKIHCHIGKTC